MKNLSKRVTSWVLVFVMCLSFIQHPAFAEEGDDITGIPLYSEDENGEQSPCTYDFLTELGKIEGLEDGTWNNSNPGVLSLENGVGTALSVGDTTITLSITQATFGGRTGGGLQERDLELVNAARAEQELSALVLDEELNSAAQVRASECLESFSHTRPDGSAYKTAIEEGASSRTGRGNIRPPVRLRRGRWQSPG